MKALSTLPARPAEAAFSALETELTELWGNINAATFRFLELLAEFDRSKAWSRHGLANCAQWLNLHCGIGPIAAREKVRVARALRELPAISAAFRNGQLSYSKVRAMTRVATPQTEDTLLNVALHGTAHHVERLVRCYRRVERIADNERANRQHADRFLCFGEDEDGSITLHARLPAEVGAIVRKAIEAALDLASQPEADADSESESGTGPAAHPVTNEARSDVSAEKYAAAGAHRESGVTIDSTDRHGSEPVGARRADALRLLAEHFLTSESARCPSSADRYQVVVHIDQRLLTNRAADTSGGELRDDADRAIDANGRACCEIEAGPALAVETARRLACDSALVGLLENADGEPLNVGRKTRSIPPAMKRALKARDGGCRFPGCDHMHFAEGHHVQHWADGGETRLSNLITLCRFHHRLLHEGGFRIQVAADGAFQFCDADGRCIGLRASVAKCFRGNNLRRLNDRRGIEVRPPPGWHGERMDYGIAIEAMLRE